ncbi:TPA: hypothetical protein N0F65_008526 [Lagenidium giganteum]|uniref:ABC transporter domain-containing protein n=1 Tax=Lagenidium giganteum TaxID=4803 RepID=A0AAV2Z0K8_9STRA|nr:TPA: hypothetical protein N0F65_008526 [Lagenidium giganteum]
MATSLDENLMNKNEHFVEVLTPKADAGGGAFATNSPQLTLEWKNLHLSVPIKNSKSKEVEEKQILKGVNGVARPGELLVIMGPSGAGKSSLLDCISARNHGVRGAVTLNGNKWTKAIKRFTAYVMQDDLFYETITVREHLVFQARLRMGSKFTPEQYLERVDTVMEELGLVKCRDTLIGGAMLRGISGGERKRLSFATEILTNPSLLFVDEPTSGLDSFMAETVVLQLQQLARNGRTVIATIHQPSSELYGLFDMLYLLSDGACVYHGKAADAVGYFGNLGFQCPSFVNPSDYFMRQLVVLDKEKDLEGVKRVQLLKDEWATKHAQSTEGTDAEVYVNDEDTYDDARLGPFGQLAVLAQRNILRLVRDKFAFQVAVGQTLFIAVIVGLIYLQLDRNQKGIQNFSGALFFIVVNQTFSAASPTFVAVPSELPMIFREYRAGLYRLAIWYFSKNVSELPMQLLLPIVFFVPAYLLIGFDIGFSGYLGLQVLTILVNSAAIALGYMVSCLCRRVDIAPIVGVVVILPFMLFGGLFLNSDDAPKYFIWIQYISPIKYGFEGMMKVFWNHVHTISCSSQPCVETGRKVLENYSMTGGSAWVDGVILLCLSICFRLVGLLALWLNLRGNK